MDLNDKLDYIYIRAYGQFHKMPARWINDEIQMARDDKAPTNVVYKHGSGFWATIEHVNGIDREHIERLTGLIMQRHNPLHPFETQRTIQ